MRLEANLVAASSFGLIHCVVSGSDELIDQPLGKLATRHGAETTAARMPSAVWGSCRHHCPIHAPLDPEQSVGADVVQNHSGPRHCGPGHDVTCRSGRRRAFGKLPDRPAGRVSPAKYEGKGRRMGLLDKAKDLLSQTPTRWRR